MSNIEVDVIIIAKFSCHNLSDFICVQLDYGNRHRIYTNNALSGDMLSEKKNEFIRNYFLEKKETLAIAESVTSGTLQVLISNVPDASEFYQGVITTYNIGQKYRHIGVEPIHAKSCNCVSSKVAEQMATNVCILFNSDWGIGVTGYATPVPESGNKLFCYYAICYKGKLTISDIIVSKKILPDKVQLFYGKAIMDILIRTISNNR